MSALVGTSIFIYNRLAADATLMTALTRSGVLNVYRDRAPQEATYPFVVIRPLTSNDVPALPATVRIQSELTFLVECYTDQPNLTTPATIINRVETVLTGAAGTVAGHGVYVHGLYRRRESLLSEEDGDRQYLRLGGEWTTTVSYT